MRKIISYNSNLKSLARILRKNMTLPEVLLWNELKQKQMLGFDFDRQRPIDDYIVDFYCKDLMLAIEVDGESHESKKELDKVRQKRLESLGVSFLRFTNDAVKYNIDFVLEDIENWIMNKIGTHPYPSV